jgi:hypothetical protein
MMSSRSYKKDNIALIKHRRNDGDIYRIYIRNVKKNQILCVLFFYLEDVIRQQKDDWS